MWEVKPYHPHSPIPASTFSSLAQTKDGSAVEATFPQAIVRFPGSFLFSDVSRPRPALAFHSLRLPLAVGIDFAPSHPFSPLSARLPCPDDLAGWNPGQAEIPEGAEGFHALKLKRRMKPEAPNGRRVHPRDAGHFGANFMLPMGVSLYPSSGANLHFSLCKGEPSPLLHGTIVTSLPAGANLCPCPSARVGAVTCGFSLSQSLGSRGIFG